MLHIVVVNENNAKALPKPIVDPHTTTNFLEALFQAFANATKYKGLKVEILMETGSHYILPQHLNTHASRVRSESFVDMTNAMFNLTVRPLRCNELLAVGFDKATNDTLWRRSASTACKALSQTSSKIAGQDAKQQVYLHNKVGSYFKVQVPNALRWEGIVLDSIDSLVSPWAARAK